MFDLSARNLLEGRSYVDGEWIDADSGATFAVTNPANGEEIIKCADLGQAETARAIDAAYAAQPAWAAKTAKERSAILRRWYELMIENADDLARLLTAEQGKPVAEAKGEILYGARSPAIRPTSASWC
jgi:succinate-semialdehyde dehydrogenase/glutarate-semialdehyde dehydrogenase